MQTSPKVLEIVHGPGPRRGRRVVLKFAEGFPGREIVVEGKPARLIHCCDRRGHKGRTRRSDTRTEAWSFTCEMTGPIVQAKPEVANPGGDPVIANQQRAQEMTARMPAPLRAVFEGKVSK